MAYLIIEAERAARRRHHRAKALKIPISQYSEDRWQSHLVQKRHTSRIKAKERSKQQRLKTGDKIRQLIWDYKVAHPCPCGYAKPQSLAFHHLNPEEKRFSIGDQNNWSIIKVVNEIKKCIVLCANCHNELHHALKLAIKQGTPITSLEFLRDTFPNLDTTSFLKGTLTSLLSHGDTFSVLDTTGFSEGAKEAAIE